MLYIVKQKVYIVKNIHNGSQGMQNQGSEDKELGDMFAKTMAELVNVIHTLNKRDLRRQDLYEMELAIISFL